MAFARARVCVCLMYICFCVNWLEDVCVLSVFRGYEYLEIGWEEPNDVGRLLAL